MHSSESCRQLKMAYKLTDTHFTLGLGRKMRVGLAAQVLSSTVANTLDALVYYKQVDPDHANTATFCRKVNAMFDLCNSVSTTDGAKRVVKAAFLDEKLKEFQAASVFLSSWRFVPSSKTMAASKFTGKQRKPTDTIPFKEGWLLSIASLHKLIPQLIQLHGFNFVSTRQFTQDHLENCFCKIRGSNGFNDRPEVRIHIKVEIFFIDFKC